MIEKKFKYLTSFFSLMFLWNFFQDALKVLITLFRDFLQTFIEIKKIEIKTLIYLKPEKMNIFDAIKVTKYL